ncbi:MAG: nitroreductase family protein [Candidatus Bathyarchaeia archaeon]
MEFIEVVRQRRSIRKYKPDPVPDEVLDQVLEAARLAPSAGNRQPWHFILVKDPERKKMLGVSSWAQEAPVVIVGCTEAASPTDIAIAFEHLVLAAANLGLGTCWIGRWGADETIKAALSIPENIRVLAVTPLGYPAESPPPKPRKPLSQVVHREKF